LQPRPIRGRNEIVVVPDLGDFADVETVSTAMKQFGIDPDKPDPVTL
jgi:hypothetical protein